MALAAVTAVGGFFPVVRSESLVVTAGVFAAGGDQSLALAIVAATLGAFTGDHVSYAIGRLGRNQLDGRLQPGTRHAGAYAWAAKVLAERGGTVIIAARYIPAGRAAVAVGAGAVHHPLAAFSPLDAIAATTCAAYAALLGSSAARPSRTILSRARCWASGSL